MRKNRSLTSMLWFLEYIRKEKKTPSRKIDSGREDVQLF